MGEGLRYNIQHIGDIFVDSLGKAIDCVQSSTRGIILTHDIHELEKSKRRVLRKIGERVAEVKKISPEHEVFNDPKLMELFSKLESLEERIKAHAKEREERLISPTYDTVDSI